MLLTVSHLTHSSLMTRKSLDRCDSQIVQDVVTDSVVLEVVLNLVLLGLLCRLLLRVECAVVGVGAAVDLFLA